MNRPAALLEGERRRERERDRGRERERGKGRQRERQRDRETLAEDTAVVLFQRRSLFRALAGYSLSPPAQRGAQS